MGPSVILSVNQIQASYGPIKALRGLSFKIYQGETLAIIGANGAGKTSLMRALSGILPITSGQAQFLNCDIRKTSTHELTRQGLLHIPEGRGTLQSLSVNDNLKLAWDIQIRHLSFEESVVKVFEVFPRLAERANQLAGLLSGGEQQMLAIGRALIHQPKLLLLDEPSMGLSPKYTTEVFKVIDALKKQGMTIALVEQNAKRALALADRAIVMAHGEFILQGFAHEIAQNPQVIESYLGQGVG
jgi:branched-chain amino acid transport system ATP-binding protein